MTYNIYADALRAVSTCKRTENGANAFSTTNNAVVDLFSVIGAMRNGDDSMDRIGKMVDAAYAEDPLLTAKCLFYARDIRGGLGEREVFRKAIYHCAVNHPEVIEKNIELIPEYGRWDDMFSLIGTPVEERMWEIIKARLEADRAGPESKVSLLAKWMPSADTSSKATRELARYAAEKLGMTVYDYKRMIRSLRKSLRLLETDMSNRNWSGIDYEHIPSQAHMRHVAAFHRNDGERYTQYLQDVNAGTAKVNTGTLYPYEILERAVNNHYIEGISASMQALWDNQPDYIGDGGNVLVIADTSGSMYGRPMMISTSLAIYFAERNTGPFANLYMTFSGRPQMIELKRTDTLIDKYRQMSRGPWGQNTNLYAALDFLAYIAVQTKARPEDMPKALVIITDMEIDSCESVGQAQWNTIVDQVREKYREYGYEMPNLVFWNVASRQDTFLARCGYKGVQMVSGSSASVFKAVLGFINGMTPLDAVRQVLNVERYSAVRV